MPERCRAFRSRAPLPNRVPRLRFRFVVTPRPAGVVSFQPWPCVSSCFDEKGSGGWWLVSGGWWLVAGDWWLVVGDWWLVTGEW